MWPPPGAMITAAPVAFPAEGREGVVGGLWMPETTGKTISGSWRQSTDSGALFLASKPGAPLGQRGMGAGWDFSRAAVVGIAGGVAAGRSEAKARDATRRMVGK